MNVAEISPDQIAYCNELASARRAYWKGIEAAVAVITNEGPDIFITLGPGDHSSQRWKISESLARKIRRELNQRLD